MTVGRSPPVQRWRAPDRASRQLRRVAAEIAAQQERRHRRRRTALARDRGVDDAADHRPVRDPGILQARNYNEEMIVVRYATLVALVIWLAAMVGEQFGDLLRRHLA
jgi:hypothetical protein